MHWETVCILSLLGLHSILSNMPFADRVIQLLAALVVFVFVFLSACSLTD